VPDEGCQCRFGVFVVCVLIVAAAAVAGGMFTRTGVESEWYQQRKADITPPGWVFSVAWSILYLLIAVSLYLAWIGAASAGQRRAVAVVFGINLILNAAWPALYFGLQRPLLAFADLIALWLSIIAMIVVTWRIRRASALLLAPYLLWVSFAGVLNWLSR